jgi:5-formyltetrahydrofolate cyclo-ligase
MRQEFEDFLNRRGITASQEKKSKLKYSNAKTQALWEAWQNGWQIAIYEQRIKDEREINVLKANIALAITTLENKRKP